MSGSCFPSATFNGPAPSRLAISWPAWSPYLVALALLCAVLITSPNFRYDSGPAARPFAGDFLQEYVGGHVVIGGDYARFYDISQARALEHDRQLVGFEWQAEEYFPLVYPPFYYLLVSPSSLLPFHTAARVWAALMVAAFMAAWRLFEVGQRKLKKGSVGPWLICASLLFMPLLESITSCQKGSVLLLILTATWYHLTARRPFTAGLVFGLIAFKPHFALPIALAMLCKGQWRFVLGGFVTGISLASLCLMMGLDVCQQYIEFSTHAASYLQNGGYDLTKSHAWYGFFTLLFGNDSPDVVRGCTLVAGVITIGLVANTLRGPFDASHPRFAWQFSTLILATVLLSPHLYTYDLTVLLLPLWLVASCQRGEMAASSGQNWLALLLFCLAGLSPQIAAISGVQLTVPLMLALLVALVHRVQFPRFSHRQHQVLELV